MNERFPHRQQTFGFSYVPIFLHIFTTALLNMMLLEETAALYKKDGDGGHFLITLSVIKQLFTHVTSLFY